MKQNSHRFAHCRTVGGSSSMPMTSPSPRSISYVTVSPSGSRASTTKSSSAVRNSQSRKSVTRRPFTDNSSVPAAMPSAAAMLPHSTRATRTTGMLDLAAS